MKSALCSLNQGLYDSARRPEKVFSDQADLTLRREEKIVGTSRLKVSAALRTGKNSRCLKLSVDPPASYRERGRGLPIGASPSHPEERGLVPIPLAGSDEFIDISLERFRPLIWLGASIRHRFPCPHERNPPGGEPQPGGFDVGHPGEEANPRLSTASVTSPPLAGVGQEQVTHRAKQS